MPSVCGAYAASGPVIRLRTGDSRRHRTVRPAAVDRRPRLAPWRHGCDEDPRGVDRRDRRVRSVHTARGAAVRPHRDAVRRAVRRDRRRILRGSAGGVPRAARRQPRHPAPSDPASGQSLGTGRDGRPPRVRHGCRRQPRSGPATRLVRRPRPAHRPHATRGRHLLRRTGRAAPGLRRSVRRDGALRVRRGAAAVGGDPISDRRHDRGHPRSAFLHPRRVPRPAQRRRRPREHDDVPRGGAGDEAAVDADVVLRRLAAARPRLVAVLAESIRALPVDAEPEQRIARAAVDAVLARSPECVG